MKRFRDRTYGETLDALRRYRPFIGAVVAVVAVQALLPAKEVVESNDTTTAQVSAAAPSTEAAAALPAAGPPATGSVGLPASGSSVGAVGGPSGSTGVTPGGAVAGAVGGAGAASQASPTAGAAPGATYPGVGTPAALAAPDCDRATGSLRMYTKWNTLPCVPLWRPGTDNGGATSMGVTADTITVAFFQPEDSSQGDAIAKTFNAGSREQMWEMAQRVTELYNRHAELYGRKVALKRYLVKGSGPEAIRAAAIDAVNKLKPFASINGTGGGTYQALDMAARKVISPTCCGPENWDTYQKLAPYLYNYNPGRNGSNRQTFYLRAEFLAKRLAGRPAKWAGDPILRTQVRKFGWLYDDKPEARSDNQQFVSELAKYGIQFAAMAGVNPTDQAQAAEQTRTAIAKFKAAGVNVILPDAAIMSALASKEATNQRYFPEWYGGEAFSGATIWIRAFWDLTQAGALYGQKAVPIQPPLAQQDLPALVNWEFGQPPPVQDLTVGPGIVLLFQGIHGAGPNLTPFTFRDALFARPPWGGAAGGSITTAQRSYGLHGVWPFETQQQPDFGAADDATYFWWCGRCRGPDEQNTQGVGMQMVPEGGRRYQAQTMPRTEPPMFLESGSVSGAIPELPANERPPNYPNKRGCPTRWQCYGTP